jgi:cadmium resistance protein CadD (predicted permease)
MFGLPENRRCEIVRVQNGFIVVVFREDKNPQERAAMGLASMIPIMQQIKQAASPETEEDEDWKKGSHDDDDEENEECLESKIQKMQTLVSSAIKAAGPTLKPIDVFVFSQNEKAKMLEFVAAFME